MTEKEMLNAKSALKEMNTTQLMNGLRFGISMVEVGIANGSDIEDYALQLEWFENEITSRLRLYDAMAEAITKGAKQ